MWCIIVMACLKQSLLATSPDFTSLCGQISHWSNYIIQWSSSRNKRNCCATCHNLRDVEFVVLIPTHFEIQEENLKFLFLSRSVIFSSWIVLPWAWIWARKSTFKAKLGKLINLSFILFFKIGSFMAFSQSYNFSQKCHYICFLLSPRFLFCN